MKVAVIGSMNIDKVATVDHIPLKGETLMARGYMETFGGKGANQAVALARLGAHVTMFGCVGNDGDGHKTMDHMAEEGIDMEHVKLVDQVPTGCAFINVGQGDNAIVVVAGANEKVDLAYLKEKSQVLGEMGMLIIQNEIPLTSVAYLLKTYGDHKTILYNPAPYAVMDQALLVKATWITPNETEGAQLLAKMEDDQLKKACIMTLGSRGAQYYVAGQWRQVGPTSCQPVDTTGAGDTFNGALAYGISQNMAIDEAILFANTAAAIATESKGAQEGMPSLEAVKKRLNK